MEDNDLEPFAKKYTEFMSWIAKNLDMYDEFKSLAKY